MANNNNNNNEFPSNVLKEELFEEFDSEEIKCGEIFISKNQINSYHQVKFQCSFCQNNFEQHNLNEFYEHVQEVHFFNFNIINCIKCEQIEMTANNNNNDPISHFQNSEEVNKKISMLEKIEKSNCSSEFGGRGETTILRQNKNSSNNEKQKKRTLRKCRKRKHSTYFSENETNDESDGSISSTIIITKCLAAEISKKKDFSHENNIELQNKEGDSSTIENFTTEVIYDVLPHGVKKELNKFHCDMKKNELIETKKRVKKLNKKYSDYDIIDYDQKGTVKPLKKKNSRAQISEELWDCKKCKKVFNANITQEEHDKISHQKRTYMCDLCGKSNLKSQTDLDDHIAGDHQGIRQYQCRLCMRTFKTDRVRQSHEFTHIREKKFTCEYCSISYGSASRLKHHLSKHTIPADQMPFKCPECSTNFLTSGELKSHLKVHVPKDNPFKCTYCPKTYKAKRGLNTHVRLIHLGEFNYECTFCKKRFIKKCYMQIHMQKHLDTEYNCNLCERKYSNSAALRKHKNQKHPDPNSKKQTYLCEKCNLEFKTSSELKEHHKDDLMKEKIFGCLVCESRHDTKVGLQGHYYRVHSKDTGSLICNLCSRDFKYHFRLLQHKLLVHDLYN